MTPDISIIVPVYKAEAYLRQCLDSILAQTFEAFELILVDDGSPDGSGAICDEYAARDGRVRVIHKENGGVAAAVITGVQASRGAYVGFVDADDWIDPDYYADLYRGITQTGADAVEAERIRESQPPVLRVRTEPVTYAGREDIRRLLREFFLAILCSDSSRWPVSYARWDKLFRRALWADNLHLMDGGLVLEDDRVELAAVLSACEKFVLLSGTAKYHYRKTADSVSHGYSETRFNSLGQLYADLTHIADVRHLDRGPVDIYAGGSCYQRIYMTAQQPALSFGEKRRRVRTLLSLVPPGVLKAYAKARGGLFVWLYCGLLQAGLIAPCVLIAQIHGSFLGKRT